MRRLSKKLELEPSRGRVFYNSSGGAAPELQFRTRSVTVVKNTSGSGFLGFNFLLSLLICVLPLALIFSYHPVISLGVGEAMNFELSVPLIWLVIFDIVGVVGMVAERKFVTVRRRWKWLIFPAFVMLSLIWSANLVRGVLTVGVMWLIVAAVMIVVAEREVWASEESRRRWWKWFFGATMVACAWCLIQCILDLAGASREYSLMCLGCTSRTFGFPHPNGFAIEPQFMGNLLLAPAIAAAWLYLRKDDCNGAFRARGRSLPSLRGSRRFYLGRNLRRSLKTPLLVVLFFIITATLFLVFSRGAIYAFVVGMVFMSVMSMVMWRKKIKLILKRVGIVWGIIVLAFVFALNMQGLMAQVGPTNDTYMDGVAKVLNQLSLGIIDIRGKSESMNVGDGAVDEDANIVEKPVEKYEDDVAVENSAGTEAIFDGYVEESTEIRKIMTRNAIRTWSQNAKTIAVGVGIGGAGQAMYDAGFTDWPKEIVQNEYANVLLELGIVGAVLALILVVMVVRITLKSAAAPMLLALVVTYGVTLVFFSGMVNALQVYLLPVVLWTMEREKAKTRA